MVSWSLFLSWLVDVSVDESLFVGFWSRGFMSAVLFASIVLVVDSEAVLVLWVPLTPLW